MRLIILLVFISLIMVSVANANPFLACDSQDGVTYYEIQNMGSLTNPNVPAQSDGSLLYDLATLEVGSFNVAVRACNQWGCSEPATFAFTRLGKPTAPKNIHIKY